MEYTIETLEQTKAFKYIINEFDDMELLVETLNDDNTFLLRHVVGEIESVIEHFLLAVKLPNLEMPTFQDEIQLVHKFQNYIKELTLYSEENIELKQICYEIQYLLTKTILNTMNSDYNSLEKNAHLIGRYFGIEM